MSSDKILSERIFFHGLGFLLLILGVSMSYLKHDSSEEFEKTYHKFFKLKEKNEELEKDKHNKLSEEEENFNKKEKALLDEYESNKNDIHRRVNSKKAELEREITSHNKLLKEFEEREKEINNMFHSCVQAYRDQNLTYLEGRNQPKSWKAEIKDLTFKYQNITPIDL